MPQFGIDVVMDPGSAERGLNRVNKGLKDSEKRARGLSRSLSGVIDNTSSGAGFKAFGQQVSGAAEEGRKLSQGLAPVPTQMAQIEESGVRAFSGLQRAIAAVGIGLLAREAVQAIDAFNNFQNRLRLVTDGQEELAAVTEELFAISNRTRVAFSATAEAYARVALSAKELGVSQQELLRFTESLNQAIVLSGASAAESQNAMIQLSQGLASGALRGDELRSVLEQLPRVADVIASGLGVTRGQLRELGAEGKISADQVLLAFREADEVLDKEFGETVPTIGQAMTVLGNTVTEMLVAFDEATGFSEKLVAALTFVSENMGVIADVAQALVLIVGVRLADAFLAKAVPAIIAFSTTLLTRGVAAIKGFGLALRTNPLGLILSALQIVIPVIIAFTDWIGDAVDAVVGFIDSSEILQAVGSALKTVLSAVATAIEFIVDAAIEGARATRELGSELSSLVNNFGPLADKVKEVTDAAREQARGQRALAEAVTFAADAWNVAGEAIRLANEQRLDSADLVESSIEKIREETNELLVNAKQRAYLNALAEAEAKARAQNRDLREDEILAIQQQVEFRFALEEATKRLEKAEKGGAKEAKRFMRSYESLRERISEQIAARRELKEAQDILDRAERRGLVTGQERVALEAEVRDQLKGKLDPMGAFIEAQERERRMLQLSNSERAIEEKVLETVNALRRAYGEELAPDVIKFIRDEITETAKLNEKLEREAKLRGLITQVGKAFVKGVEDEVASQEQLRQAFDDRIQGMEEEIEIQQLLNQGKTVEAEVQRIINEERRKNNDLGPDQVAQLRSSLGTLRDLRDTGQESLGEIGRFGGQVFQGLTDDLVEFAFTGEQAFRQSVNQMLKDLTKLLIKMAAFEALTQGLEFSPGTAKAFTGVGGFASGGEFDVGGAGPTDSQVVAFRATPGEHVIVQTPAQRASGGEGGGAPSGQTAVVNVFDRRELARTIASMPEMTDFVINTVTDHRDLLGRS